MTTAHQTQPVIPFPGPRPYSEEFAFYFLGRDEDLRKAEAYVTRQRLSVLTAASSCGKTSMLQAGLVPRLRFARLDAVAGDAKSTAGFPLLLNQWVGRVGSVGAGGFAQLLILETHRYLTWARDWYEATATAWDEEPAVRLAAGNDAAAITRALVALAETAVAGGFAILSSDEDSETLKFDAELARSATVDVQHLLKRYYGILTEAFGNAIVILDQFEEILNDARLGREAVHAVEFAYRAASGSVSQLISMREDSRHLLRPFEDGGTLGEKRMLYIEPLRSDTVQDIVVQVGSDISVEVDRAAIARLIAAFTEVAPDGDSRDDVNLLGLQVVLKSLFSKATEGKSIGMESLASYCRELSESEDDLALEELELWLSPHNLGDERALGMNRNDRMVDYPDTTPVRALIAQVAPLRWLTECLDPTIELTDARSTPSDVAEEDFSEDLVRPMVSRMAEWLVTPSGFKRPMTFRELRAIAFTVPDDDRDLAGDALERGWSVDEPGGPVTAHLETTLAVALHRLVEVGHILKVRGTEQDASYELVHDQFGRPLQEWSHTFWQSPEASLGSLYAIDDLRFAWGRRTPESERTVFADSLPSDEGVNPALRFAKWRGCVIQGVDFTGVDLESCDFSRTLFRDCRFAESALRDCVLTAALFDQCEFEGVQFGDCSLESAGFNKDCTLISCMLKGGSLSHAELNGARLRDCSFEGAGEGERLPMRNIQLIDLEMMGTTRFVDCSLDGATVGAESDDASFVVENVEILGCDMKGAEFVGLHFGAHSLLVTDTLARGSVFIDVTFGAEPGASGARFSNVDLTGSVMRACELRNVHFSGADPSTDRPAVKTPAPTLVIRSAGRSPSVLSDVSFTNLDMENFSFEDCVLEGAITFAASELSGGTIAATGAVPEAVRVRGSLSFSDGCDLSAVEFSGLDFSDARLRFEDCIAPSLYFGDVDLPVSEDGWRAEFLRCVTPGLLFQGSHVHGVRIAGIPADEATPGSYSKCATLIVRGAVDSGESDETSSGDSYTFGDCSFEWADLENFTFERLVIDGPLAFRHCLLSGGTIGGIDESIQDDMQRHMSVKSSISFDGGCDLSAVEISGVTFQQGSAFRATDSSCDGMLILRVNAESDGATMFTFDRTTLAGSVFLDSQLRGVVVRGRAGEPVAAWGLTVRRTHADVVMSLGDVSFSDMSLDGLVLQNVELTGPVVLERSSVLRCLLDGIGRQSDAAYVDLRDSDVLYAQIASDTCSGPRDGCPLRLTDAQWDAVERAAQGSEPLRYS